MNSQENALSDIKFPMSYSYFPILIFLCFISFYVFELLQTNKQKKEVITILLPKCLVWHLMQGLNCRLKCQKLKLKTRMWWADLRPEFRSVYIFPGALLTRVQVPNVVTTQHILTD